MTLHVAARAYLGVPFRHQGRNPAVGIDCIGLLVVACLGAGLPVAHHDARYGRDPHDGLLDAHLRAAFGAPVSKASLRVDDVVSIDYEGAVRHVAIVGERDGELTLIHTAMNVGRVVEHRIDAKWLRRIVHVYRPEVPDVR